jgi:hypothetical protein
LFLFIYPTLSTFTFFLSQGATPTCAIAESGMLLFGDEYGNIIISDRDFNSSSTSSTASNSTSSDRRTYKIFNGEVIGLSYLFDKMNNNKQYIVAIGDDSRPVETLDGTMANPSPVYVIKMYNTADMLRPLVKLNATISDGYVTSFACLHDGLAIAVGYSNGKILLFTGLFLKDFSASSSTSSSSSSTLRPSPPTTILVSHFAPVSALYFCEIGTGYGDERKIKLFAVFKTEEQVFPPAIPGVESDGNITNDPAMDSLIEQEDIEHAGIIVFDTSLSINNTKGQVLYLPREDPKALDGKGSTSLNASFMKNNGELIIARNEAIYTYTIEGRGGALAIFGEKQSILTVGRYTLVVSLEEKSTGSIISTGGIGDLPAAIKSSTNRCVVTIYDLKNKFICGTTKKYFLPNMNERILYIFSDGGIAYLLTTGWNLIRFREKDVNRKLDVLLNQVKPPLYSLAITLAGEEQLDPQEIMKLYKVCIVSSFTLLTLFRISAFS